MLVSESPQSSKFILDTGWVQTKHIASLSTLHYSNSTLPTEEPLVFLVDFSIIDRNTFGTSNLISILLSSKNTTGDAQINYAFSAYYYGFNRSTKLYSTQSITGATNLQKSYGTFRVLNTGALFYMPDGSIGTSVYLGDSSEFTITTGSAITSTTKFAYRVRVITEDAAVEVFA